MAEFEPVTTWEVAGLANMLVDCGMIEGNPWFDKMMQVGTHFHVEEMVDSVSEMVEQGLSAKFMKAFKAEFPKFQKTKKWKKLRELLAEMRPASSDDSSSSSGSSVGRGRPSKFSNDLTLEWVTNSNPHKEYSKCWCMWEVAYGAKDVRDFKACVKMPPIFASMARTTGYLSNLIKAGHVIINV